MRIRKVNLLLNLFFLLVFMAGCEATSKVSLQNLIGLYQPEKQFSELNSCVYHTSDSTSTLFVEVLFSNLVYRINTLRLDRKAYRNFDTSPGEVPLGQWARKKSGNRVLPMALSHPVRKPETANATVFSID